MGSMGPSEIIASIPDKYQSALSSTELRFFPSEVHKVEDFGVEVSSSRITCMIVEHLVTVH